MSDQTIPHIPLKEAHLCMNCDMVFTWRNNKTGCPGCGGTTSMHVVRIIAPMEPLEALSEAEVVLG